MKTTKAIIDCLNAKTLYSTIEAFMCLANSRARYIAEIDIVECHHCTINTLVYQAKDGFIGIRGPCKLTVEGLDCSDLGYECEVFEMTPDGNGGYRRK